MSNLFKSGNIKCEKEDARIIDNNELISEKLEQIKEILKQTIDSEEEESEEVEFNGFTEGLNPQTVNMLVSENEDIDIEKRAEELLLKAKEDAAVIIEEAKKQAEIIMTETIEKAKKEAYEVAIKQAQEETQKMKNEVIKIKEKQELEYQKKMEEMEPLLVDAILKVFNKVTNVLAEDKKDMILHLVNSVMTKTELSRNFIIRVSKDDYNFLIDSREKIYGALLKDANIEIIEDVTMKRNQCIIETDGGIYDCSLDIQLENLTKDIKTLACMLD